MALYFDMHEWMAMALFGAVGGLAATAFADRRPSAFSLPVFNKDHRFRRWLFEGLVNGLLNMCGGAMASFLLWATYTSSMDFNSVHFTPSEVAAALTVGLGGVGVVRGLIHEKEETKEWKETSQGTLERFRRFLAIQSLDESSSFADTERGGPSHEQRDQDDH